MRILVDESVDGPIALLARDQDRTLITADRDFGELVFRHGLRPPAVVLLRIRSTSSTGLAEAFAEHWPRIEGSFHGKFVVLSRGRFRVLPL